MPGNPETFEDSLGNPDWAASGKSVSRSDVSDTQLDGNSDVSETDSTLNPEPERSRSKKFMSLAKAAILGTLSLLFCSVFPVLAVQMAPAGSRQSLWLYLGLLTGGLFASILQIRSAYGLLPSSATAFGALGAKITIFVALSAMGIAAGVSVSPLAWSWNAVMPILVFAGLSFLAMLVSASWLLRALTVMGGLGYLIYSHASGGLGLAFAPASIETAAQPDIPLFLTGFVLVLAIQMLVPMNLLMRLVSAVASPLLLLLLDLGLNANVTNLQLSVAIIGGLALVFALPQLGDLTRGRLRVLLLQLAAVLVLVASVAVALAVTAQLSRFLPAAALSLVVWSLMQIPSALARKKPLHSKSLGLGYGFYGSVAWPSLIGLPLATLALAVSVWLGIGLDWLLVGAAAAGLLLGFLSLPRFLASQSEHLAAEKRKNEPVRVSSEDLQWSD